MHEERENDPAVQYARAKVEEIRKRIGHYPSQLENCSKENEEKYVGSRACSRENTENCLERRKDPIRTPLQPKNQNFEYQSRIHNIDMINEKIRSVLKSEKKPLNPRISSDNNRPSRPSLKKNENNSPIKVLDGPSKKPSRLNQLASNTSVVSVEMTRRTYENQAYKSSSGSAKNLEDSRTEKYSEYPSKKSDKYSKYNEQDLIEKKLGGLSENKIQFETKGKGNTFKADSEEYSKKETIKLAERLSGQIKLDQNLRQAKWEFSQFDSKDKWELLATQCQIRGYHFSSQDEIQKTFKISSEEHNPFFQTSQVLDEKCIDSLLTQYEKAKKYWNSDLSECVSISRLEAQNFSIKDIDSTKKGYISLQDLVCFVNLYTGNFFRNRDVISVQKRFTENTEKLKYQTFLDKVTARS